MSHLDKRRMPTSCSLSQLQGTFTDFTATFTHSDALGGLDTSLISSVRRTR